MVFNSFSYLLFFPVVFIIYFVLPAKIRHLWLLAASYFFYMQADVRYLYLLLALTLLSYIGGIAIWQAKTLLRPALSKVLFIFTVVCNLGILGYFKYTNFLLENLNKILSLLHVEKQFALTEVLLTMGISFIVFQSVSYTADVYRGTIPAEKNILYFALYLAFFPKLISGPIERADDILKQIHAPSAFSLKNLKEGLSLILMGLFYKLVFSDNVAAIINPVFASYQEYSGLLLVFALVLFKFQIYADFAGYSYIAIGSAKAFGFQLTNNFEAPFHSESVSEFWRRWHITLNNWLRDYLYIPLGGNRKGSVRTYFNTLVVFLLSGLWHGAEWSYLVWGGLNGLYIVAENIIKKHSVKHSSGPGRSRNTFSFHLRRKVSTLILVVFSFLFFCMPDVPSALGVLRRIVAYPGIRGLFNLDFLCIFPNIQNFVIIMAALCIILGIDTLIYRRKTSFTTFFFEQSSSFRWLSGIIILCMIIFFGAYGDTYEQTQFIYFQF